MISYRHGALHVVESARPQQQVLRDLRSIDDRLFLEMQLTTAGEEVWCVVCDVGSGQPPITIMEWRDQETGRPIMELTSGLAERVSRMDRDGSRLSARVVRANEAKVEEQRRAAYDIYREIATDMVPRMRPTRSVVLPRSQSLRLARDKARGQGRNV